MEKDNMACLGCMLLLLSMPHMAASQDIEFSECKNDGSCAPESAALSLLQLNSGFVTEKARHSMRFSTSQSGYWIYGTYHKTGCELVRGMCERLSGSMPDYHFIASRKDLTYDPFHNWYYQPDIAVLNKLPEYRFVHMIRDPADLIVSAYRFHVLAKEEFLQNPMNDERFWMDQFYGYLPEMKMDATAFEANVSSDPVHRSLMNRFFHAVDEGKSLPEFYKNELSHRSVLMEAYRSKWQIDMMVKNFEATRNDEYTLQVRMENVKKDFEKNMKCIFDFLSEAHTFDVESAMQQVDSLNTEKYGTKASAEEDADHITKTIDNTALLEELTTIPWLKEVTEKMSQDAMSSC